MQLKTAETQETAKTARIGETARTADFKFQTAKKTSNLLKTTAKEPQRRFCLNLEGNWWTAKRSSLPNPDLIGATICALLAALLIPSGRAHSETFHPIRTKLTAFSKRTTGHLPSKFRQNRASGSAVTSGAKSSHRNFATYAQSLRENNFIFSYCRKFRFGPFEP